MNQNPNINDVPEFNLSISNIMNVNLLGNGKPKTKHDKSVKTPSLLENMFIRGGEGRV